MVANNFLLFPCLVIPPHFQIPSDATVQGPSERRKTTARHLWNWKWVVHVIINHIQITQITPLHRFWCRVENRCRWLCSPFVTLTILFINQTYPSWQVIACLTFVQLYFILQLTIELNKLLKHKMDILFKVINIVHFQSCGVLQCPAAFRLARCAQYA